MAKGRSKREGQGTGRKRDKRRGTTGGGQEGKKRMTWRRRRMKDEQ